MQEQIKTFQISLILLAGLLLLPFSISADVQEVGQPSAGDLSTITTKLKHGTPAEKEQALYKFRDGKVLDAVPDVIAAVSDATVSPRHDDTGWGFVGHQAASMLQIVARSLDGIDIKERGRKEFSFFDDQYKGGEQLKQEGRLQEVQGNWQNWWTEFQKERKS